MAHIPRLYVPQRIAPGPLLLDAVQARRLATVMRAREGDEFRVFGGDGREWAARVRATTRSGLSAEVTELVRQEAGPAVVLEVWVGLVRASRFDWAIEKCVEAGADVVRPLLSDHAARGEGDSAARGERWGRIAIEAAEQCGRLTVPPVEGPVRFGDAIGHLTSAFICADGGGRSLTEITALLPVQGRVVLAIGPEGGWSEAELGLARSRGGLALSLGPNILRTETAAVVGTAMLRSALP